MRKTKCKSCNGDGIISISTMCPQCQATGEISVYTIQELREGKVVMENDFVSDIKKVLSVAFNYDYFTGDAKYYAKTRNFNCEANTHLFEISNGRPTQSVKIFLEEIEQEDINVTQSIEEPEFKWGEEVEWKSYEEAEYVPGTYLCKHPDSPSEHLVFDSRAGYSRSLRSTYFVRKPQQITLTLSQIAEKFNYDRNKIKVDLEK